MKIILIRHGMTEGNLKRRYIGTTDEDLINTDCLKGDYPKCERVVASPLKRCIQTAEYIYPNVDIEICDKLKECDFGDFENKSYEDLKDNPDYQKWLDSNGELPFPNGETHEDFKNRCKEGFFESLTERDTAFVIHGGSIMAIMQKLFGGNFYDYQVKNGCGYEFEMRNGEIVDDFKLHPIRLIGYLISFLEKVMRRIFAKNERLGGAVMAICVLIICGGVPFAILFFAYRLNYFFGIAIESVICYFMLAAKSLKQAGMSVYKPLKNGDVDGARKSVSMIVGRDTESLDDIGITKAAVETVAENTSDGVIAPLIYMAIGGGVLGCVYKAINTMDSMVGYKNDRYINFGRFAAKLDDIANYIPSRISAYLMIFASKIMGSLRVMRTISVSCTKSRL